MLLNLPHKFLSLVLLLSVGCAARMPTREAEDMAAALVARGVLLMEHGDLSTAEASFRVSAEMVQGASAYDGLACIRFLQGDVRAAEREWKQVIEWFPDYIPAYANLATMLDLEGRKKEARIYYEYVINNDPANFKVRNNFGVMLREQGLNILGRSFLHDSYALVRGGLAKENLDLDKEEQ